MIKLTIITLVQISLLTASPIAEEIGMDEKAILFSLETVANENGDDIDETIRFLENNPEIPWSDAGIGRALVIKGRCRNFVLQKLLNQNEGITLLKRAAEENPADFCAKMWLGASAVDSNYLFISAPTAIWYLSGAVEILLETGFEMRAYFLSYCYYFLGLIEKDSGDLKRALNHWELAVEIDPGGRMTERASNLIGIFTG